MRKVCIEPFTKRQERIEIVERKGIGHPDTICDSMMEQISIQLAQEYLKKLGHFLHYNIDKGLLSAGKTDIKFGGGIVLEPMKIIIGDRATFKSDGIDFPINDIAISAAKKWFRDNIRFVNPDEIVYQSELKPASPELGAIFKKKGMLGSNDTSAAVGYAPLSELEKKVLKIEKFMNSKEFKKRFPESGEDVKVMGVRHDSEISITVAHSFVDRYVKNEADYFRKKEELLEEIKKFADTKNITVNNLDSKGKGIDGCYLTVTGTSAESADCGEVGRGNRVNGIIPLNRPIGSEAAAGKNAISHVGKIYNVLSHKIAGEIHKKVPGVEEVYVWMVTKIGAPVDQPLVSVQLSGSGNFMDLSRQADEVVHKELDHIQQFCMDLANGKYTVC